MFRCATPVLVIGLFSLAMCLGVHQYSLTATEAHLQRIEDRDKAAQAERAAARQALIAAARAVQAKEATARQAAARTAMIAALPGNPKMGRMKFMTCMSCHGLKGEGQRAFNTPRLAGQSPWYIKAQLLKFKAGMRGGHPQDVTGRQMAPMARLLATEQVVDDVVAFIASLDAGRPADASKGDPAQGQPLFAVCSTCHGRQAEGIEAQKGPWLSGQHAWYLVRQLKNFRDERRGYHDQDIEGKLMIPMAQMLPDDVAIENLVAYIRSLSDE